jgi:hypothetical protein
MRFWGSKWEFWGCLFEKRKEKSFCFGKWAPPHFWPSSADQPSPAPALTQARARARASTRARPHQEAATAWPPCTGDRDSWHSGGPRNRALALPAERS